MVGNISGATVNLFDGQGRLVMTDEVPGKQQYCIMNLKDLQPGIYYLRIEQGGKLLKGEKFTKIK